MIHELKTYKKYFEDVLLGIKTFEYRKNDRNFRVGDSLRLKEIDDNLKYTGREFSVKVEYVFTDFPDLPEDYCIMSISLI